MTDFCLKESPLYMTLLSPVHIGCGEAFDPTCFVVDGSEGVLYHFNPSTVRFTPEMMEEFDKKDLYSSYVRICSFYKKYLDYFRDRSDYDVDMDEGCLKQFEEMLSSKGERRWDCERLMTERVDGRQIAYIPGSSVKGAFKTAAEYPLGEAFESISKRLSESMPAKERLNKELLSPMRFLKVSDFRMNDGDPLVCCQTANRYYKDDRRSRIPCGITAYFETIRPAQYRIFKGAVTLTDSMNKLPKVENVYHDIHDLFRDVNNFSKSIWEKESAIYQKADPTWTESVENLLLSLSKNMERGEICLARLGKNTGAESKTLENRAIDLRHRPRGKQKKVWTEKNMPETTTLWLTGALDGGKGKYRGLPFGWVLLECGDSEGCEEIQKWCGDVDQFIDSDLE